MTKRKRDEQLVIRVATPLRLELEAAAAEAERDLSDLCRRVLIDFCAARHTVVETKTNAA